MPSENRNFLTVDSRENIAELDGIRGLAIFFVLLWHYMGIPLAAPPESLLMVVKHSLVFFRTGVDLFFVLSGFLISGILLDNRESDSYFRVFYGRRALRIFPLYYVWLSIFCVANLFDVSSYVFVSPIPLWSYFSFTQNYAMASMGTYGAVWLGVTWSLAIEEQFYLIFPLVIRWSRIFFLCFITLGIVGAPLLRIYTYYHFQQSDWESYVWLPCRLDSLCWGALLAFLCRQPRALNVLGKIRTALPVGVLILSAGAVFLGAKLAEDVGYHSSIWGHTYLAVFYSSVILIAVVWRGQGAVAFLRAMWLRKLGRISYGVYLVHSGVLALTFAVLHRARHLGGIADALIIGLALTITLTLCAASYRWFESPLLKIGRRLNYD